MMKKKAQIKPTFEHENALCQNYSFIAGIDEVGRGAIAGPIVAGAVIFENYQKITRRLKEVDDSKKLSPEKRIELDEIIRSLTSQVGIGQVEAGEIDKIGIGAANVLAFERAIEVLSKCGYALIDGRSFHGFSCPYHCIERGDSISISIAAASIVAKVYRDNLMIEASSRYPDYQFDRNKGYGDKHHFGVILEKGPSEIHRKSFLSLYYEKKNQKTLF